MNSKQSGLVLVTTLMFILISSLLVLTQMQLFLIDYKVLNQFNEKRQSFQALETAANLVAEADLPVACVLQEDSAKLAVDLLKNKRGCLFNHEKQSYYYFIEDLGIFPCLQVQREQELFSTHHLRISLRSMGKYPAILLVRYAKLAKFVHCSMQKPRQIRLGLLSWRVLKI